VFQILGCWINVPTPASEKPVHGSAVYNLKQQRAIIDLQPLKANIITRHQMFRKIYILYL
jgi:hypothetical protein